MPHAVSPLLTGEKVIYLATKLYDFTQKKASLSLEEAVFEGLREACQILGIDLTVYPFFMPFRDSVENIQKLNQNISIEEKAREIFNHDIMHLNKSFCLVTYLNDICKDEGICFEIGYTFSRNAPILAVVTDFIQYSLPELSTLAFPMDPVLVRICNVIHQHEFPSSHIRSPKDRNLAEMDIFVQDYRTRLHAAEAKVLNLVATMSRQLFLSPGSFVNPINITNDSPVRKRVFIDFSGGLFEWNREFARDLAKSLTTLGYEASIATRNTSGNPEAKSFSSGRDYALHLGEIDIQKCLSADLIVISSDDAETNAGTAALAGMAYSKGIPVVLYYSGNMQTVAAGRKPTLRNLMLLYSATKVVREFGSLPTTVSEIL